MADELDDLFALPPSEFTAARDALVKKLRAAGQRERAAEVKKLRRPTVPAWAVNQVTRRHPETIEALIEAGADVATAQRRALSGVRESGLRAASNERRERMATAWQQAKEILVEAGVAPDAHRQAVTDTFDAASLDADAAAAVRAGSLSTHLPAPSGFGDVAGFSVVADADDEQVAQGEQVEPAEDPDAAARAALEAARRDVATAEQHADELEQRAGDARQAAVRTGAEAERLEQRAADVRSRADRLEAEAATAADRASAARDAADAAAAHLRQLEDAGGR